MKLRKNDLLYAGLTAEEYKKIEADVMQENRHNLTLYSAIVAVFFAVMFVLSLFLEIAKAGRWFYLGALFVDLILFVSFKYAKMSKTAVLLCVYFFWSVMLAAGILLAVIVAPAKNTVTFIALILIAPLLFTDKPIRVIGFIYLFAIAFVVAAAFLKDPSVRMMDIIHVVLFTTVSVIVGFVVIRAKYQRCLYNYNLKVLSLTDLLTGVNNRNSFEINKSARIGLCAKVMGCCYVDANGLHECNNEFGHNNGDELLKNIAKELTGLFGRENVYRIGGDEFVAFLTDAEEVEKERILGELQGFSVREGNILSFGYAEQQFGSLDVELLIGTAETEMYRAKKNFYAQQKRSGSR